MAKADPFKLLEPSDLSRQNGSVGSLHIPISLLWEYTLDSTSLVQSQLEHLKNCDGCIFVHLLCHLSNSLDHARKVLRKTGVVGE